MTMKNLLATLAALVSLNAHAELKPGDPAPGFTATAGVNRCKP